MLLPLEPRGLYRNLSLLPEHLAELGYHTHMVGKWHLGFCSRDYLPTSRGFSTFAGYYTGTTEEESGRRKGRGRRCCLGDVLECRTRDLAARMIWKKHPFWEGGGLMWCDCKITHFFRSIHSAKRPFFYASTVFLQIVQVPNMKCGIEWIQFCPTTFAFSDV